MWNVNILVKALYKPIINNIDFCFILNKDINCRFLLELGEYPQHMF